MNKKKVIGLIPSRLSSSRLPNKPLVEICGLPMIEHVYKRSLLAKMLDDLYVVTDSPEIFDTVKNFGGKAIMTSSEHQTGTDRIAEAAQNIDCDYIVNIQGDEALVDPDHIDKIIKDVLNDESCSAGILVTPFQKYNSPSDIKVVLNKQNEVMYLSRNDIPSSHRTPNASMLKAYHIIPFKKEFLLLYATLEKTPLEKIEYNEYLRILENGFKIKASQVDSDAISVDTESDLHFVREQMPKDKYFKQYNN